MSFFFSFSSILHVQSDIWPREILIGESFSTPFAHITRPRQCNEVHTYLAVMFLADHFKSFIDLCIRDMPTNEIV